MIVAGIGSRKGVAAADVLAAIDAALAAHALPRTALAALATTTFKQDEAGIFQAAQVLGLDVVVVSDSHATPTTPSPLWGGIKGGGTQPNTLEQYRAATDAEAVLPPPLTPPHKGEGVALAAIAPEAQILSHSPLSQKHAGTPSVSETAALLAAGPRATLLGPRIANGRVTCALARSGGAA